ncbi:MAG: hypothetical protein K8U03_22375 [Planctomycetia bacterium]|nr:hypothetical protein [Planctomycetia bacterium]
MWCSSCRQDVPGVLNVVGGSHGCPRCGTLLAEDTGLDLIAALDEDSPAAEFGIFENGPTTHNAGRTTPDGLAEAPHFEPVRPPRAEPARVSSLRWEAANWELNEKLRHVERVTAGTRRRFDPPAATADNDARRPHFADSPNRKPLPPRAEAHPPSYAPPAHSPYDAPQYAPSQFPSPYGPSAPQGPGPQSPANPYETSPHEWNERGPSLAPPSSTELAVSFVSWLFLGIAVTAFSCGGFLAGWGAIAARPNLEQLGMPIILCGLLALVIGLLPQLFLRHAQEERKLREAALGSHGESRTHTAFRPPHFAQRRNREYDRAHEDRSEY